MSTTEPAQRSLPPEERPRPPATIVFSMLDMESHLAASFPLARALVRRGHRIVYLGPENRRSFVHNAGFAFVTCFPSGGLDDNSGLALSPLPDLLAELRAALWPQDGDHAGVVQRLLTLRQRLRVASQTSRACFAYFDGGDFARLLRERAVDMVIADWLMPFAALAAFRLGVSSVVLSTHYLFVADSAAMPPRRRAVMVPDGRISKLRITLTWELLRLRLRVAHAIYVALGARNYFYDPGTPVRLLEGPGARGYHLERRASYPLPLPEEIPKLLLHPEALDVPRAPRKDCFHVDLAVGIDLEKPDPEIERFPWELIDRRKRLVFCHLGDLAVREPRRTEKFLRALFGALSAQGDWQLLVATGEQLAAWLRAALPDGAIALARVPRLEVLKRAAVALMITHGGLNNIKECLYYGVPVLVCPFDRDHWANASRIKYQGIGDVASYLHPSAEELRVKVMRLCADASLRDRLSSLQARIEEAAAATHGVELIERFLRELTGD